ncbi:hypothetical protein F4808DRAFT_44190 [Astrocystis sublimbata]|nr:hypothetical protein F4808DRAFT_445529 [Astrocystis sublimbata]KAI0189442.1 hypothetical protein F4808DRAFT_44190 [Astrocystis sublimbata]
MSRDCFFAAVEIARILRLVIFFLVINPIEHNGFSILLQLPQIPLFFISTGAITFSRDVVDILDLQRGCFDPFPPCSGLVTEGLVTVEAWFLLLYTPLYALQPYLFGGTIWSVISARTLLGTLSVSLFIPCNALLSTFILYQTSLRYVEDKRRAREFRPMLTFTSTGEPVLVLKRRQAVFNPAYDASMDSLLIQSTDESYVMEAFDV